MSEVTTDDNAPPVALRRQRVTRPPLRPHCSSSTTRHAASARKRPGGSGGLPRGRSSGCLRAGVRGRAVGDANLGARQPGSRRCRSPHGRSNHLGRVLAQDGVFGVAHGISSPQTHRLEQKGPFEGLVAPEAGLVCALARDRSATVRVDLVGPSMTTMTTVHENGSASESDPR